jgi:hypothetical protein
MSQTQRLEHIDLFDGPSWDDRDYWDDVPKARSKLGVVVQVLLGIGVNLLVPAAFAGALFGLGWGWNHLLDFQHILFP